MQLKDFVAMGTCSHCGEWTKVFPHKGGYWCKPDIDFDKAKAVSKGLNDSRNIHDREVRRALG